jgi:hypothetical protein
MSRATEDSNRFKNPDATDPGKVYGRSSIPNRNGPVPAPVHAGEAPPDEPHPGEDGQHSGRRPRRMGWKAFALTFLMVVGFAGASVGYSLLQPTVHGAQAEFILTPRPELSDTSVDRAMVTQTMIIESDSVLGPVATKAGIRLNGLRVGVSAAIVGRSNVLRLTVGDRDQAEAVRLVELISAEYLRASGASASATTASPTGDRTRPITPSVLTAPSPLDRPLQPQPLRALAAGILLGLLAAAAAVTVMVRPRSPTRPSPHRE